MNSCNRYCERFEIIAALNMQIKVFFDVTQCSLVEIYPHFRATCPARETYLMRRTNASGSLFLVLLNRFTLKWVRVGEVNARNWLEELNFGINQAV